MISHVDSEVHHYQVLTEVTYQKIYDSTITNVYGLIKSSNGNLQQKRKNCGLKLLVQWKDSSVYWVPLKYHKQSIQVELAEYYVANEIIDEPVFSWWVKETLHRQDRITYKVKSKYWSTSHKFGIQVPKTVKKAYDIDRKSGTGFWTKSISKEIGIIHIEFEKLDGVTPNETRKGKIRSGYEHINVHMIFDIKMDGKCTIE